MKRLWMMTAGIVTTLSWIISVRAIAASVPTLVVEPARLTLSTTLNSSVVLRLEITSANALPETLDLRAEGIHIQREITRLPGNRVVFLIEPETTHIASIDSHINVVDGAGTVLCSIPVADEVRPCVRISPARWFLGGLEYGTTSGRVLEKRFRLTGSGEWKILGIDTTDIPDASSEIIADTGEDKELIVRFTEDAMKAGQPFGAFIKRSIRIRTSIAEQPAVSIPIEAMLSVNRTQRNFSTYVFRGNERWHGRWSTPNIAAAVIAPLVLLLLGWGAVIGEVPAKWTEDRGTLFTRTQATRWVCRMLAAALLVLSSAAMVILVKTYSRGGWTAFGAGLALMLVVMKGQRRRLLAGAAFFLALMLVLPAGLERVASVGSVNADKSIGHRLLVWRGALEMIADHPWRGVGAGRFGEVFEAYYQEPWHKDQYTTAVSDYLTFAAERGLVGVVGVVGTIVCLAVAAVGYSRCYGDVWLVPVVGALLTLGTSSIFSSIEFVGEVRWLSGIGVTILAVYCGLRFVLERTRRRNAERVLGGKIWLPSAGAGFAVGGLLVGAVMVAAWMRPASCLMSSNIPGKTPLATRIDYRPGRRAVPKGTLLFLPASPEPLPTIGKQVLRPLAECGWHTVALDLRMYDQEAAGQVAAALHGLAGHTLVLAEGTRARVALMAARLLDSPHRPKLIFVDPVFFSALSECDQSSAQEIVSGTAVITRERWQAFRQDGRSGLNTIIQTCDDAARRASDFGLDASLAGASPRPGYTTVPVSATGL